TRVRSGRPGRRPGGPPLPARSARVDGAGERGLLRDELFQTLLVTRPLGLEHLPIQLLGTLLAPAMVEGVELRAELVGAGLGLARRSRDIPGFDEPSFAIPETVRALYHEPRDEVKARRGLARRQEVLAQRGEVRHLATLAVERAEGAIEVAASGVPEGV